ncbi:MAG: PorP/SprF family type IX secretion system membrane protein [Chitinophagaceae bacterium]
MKKTIICSLAIILLIKNEGVNAQVDPHFSQYYSYPLWLNPAMAGVMEGDYRVTAVYRKQWGNVMTPFSTAGVSADFTTNKNLNFGISMMNQTAGDGGYRYLNAYGTIAYSGMKWGPDKTKQVVFGIQAGLLSRRFDPGKFQFGDQWNTVTGYDPNLPTADFLSKTSASVLDLGAGVTYQDATSDQKANFYAGFSAFHLTQPEDPFITTGTGKQVLPVRYAVNAGVRIRMTDVMSIVPNVLYMRQGNAQEKMLGIFGQFDVNDFTSLFFGGSYRLDDAFSPYVGFSYGTMRLGMSYDVNTSELGKIAKETNSLEISLTWTGRRSGKPLRYLSCPRF